MPRKYSYAERRKHRQMYIRYRSGYHELVWIKKPMFRDKNRENLEDTLDGLLGLDK